MTIRGRNSSVEVLIPLKGDIRVHTDTACAFGVEVMGSSVVEKMELSPR